MEKLSPLIHRFLTDNLNDLIQKWEEQRKSISIWHNGPIDDRMLESVNNIVQTFSRSPDLVERMNRSTQIDLVVNSGGGYIEPAYQTICLLDRMFPTKPINFVVPRFAKSAATLLACGCDRILFSQVGELGPLDVQINRGPNARPISGITINRLIEDELKGRATSENMKEWIYRTLKPEEVLEMKRFNEVAAEYLRELLPRRMFKEKNDSSKINQVIHKLCNELPNHSFVIDYSFARNKLYFKAEYVSREEETLLQNVREIWDYYVRLENLNRLYGENKTLKNLIGKYTNDTHE